MARAELPVWDVTQWPQLAQHIRKGFEYAKRRCTAYPRFVVQRRLLPAFLETYLPVLRELRFGHPLAVANPTTRCPTSTSARSSRKQGERADRPARRGAGRMRTPPAPRLAGDGKFVPGQDTSTYVAPASVLEPAAPWSLRHAEPFGPLDSVVCGDTEAEFIAAMNVSNGCLVASIATDDPTVGARAAEQLQAFKVGINKPRSRGDRDEVFGDIGYGLVAGCSPNPARTGDLLQSDEG